MIQQQMIPLKVRFTGLEFDPMGIKNCIKSWNILMKIKLNEDTFELIRKYYDVKINLPVVEPFPSLELSKNIEPSLRESLFKACIQYKFYSPQIYSIMAESNLLNMFGIKKNIANLNNGDGYHPVFGNIEIKISITDHGKWIVQQVRDWQDIDNYLIMLCDLKTCFLGLYLIPAPIIYNYAKTPSHKSNEYCLNEKTVERGFSLTPQSDFLKEIKKYDIIKQEYASIDFK
jgi:hypothetical protein